MNKKCLLLICIGDPKHNRDDLKNSLGDLKNIIDNPANTASHNINNLQHNSTALTKDTEDSSRLLSDSNTSDSVSTLCVDFKTVVVPVQSIQGSKELEQRNAPKGSIFPHS